MNLIVVVAIVLLIRSLDVVVSISVALDPVVAFGLFFIGNLFERLQ